MNCIWFGVCVSLSPWIYKLGRVFTAFEGGNEPKKKTRSFTVWRVQTRKENQQKQQKKNCSLTYITHYIEPKQNLKNRITKQQMASNFTRFERIQHVQQWFITIITTTILYWLAFAFDLKEQFNHTTQHTHTHTFYTDKSAFTSK